MEPPDSPGRFMVTAGGLHAGLSVAGVALLLAGHPALLTLLQWIGAAVLVWWGFRSIQEATREVAPAGGQPPPARRSYLEGLLCTGTNPKVGLFFLAFLPQFVPPGAAPGPTMAGLATVHLGLAAVWLMTLTELVLQFQRRIMTESLQRCVQVLTGVLFIGLAWRLAFG